MHALLLSGVAYDELMDDPNLGNKRQHLITLAANKLASAKMINFDEHTGSLSIADLGRIAAKYYIRHSSIEIFNTEFRPVMSEADVLAMLTMSTEVGLYLLCFFLSTHTNLISSIKFKFGNQNWTNSKSSWTT